MEISKKYLIDCSIPNSDNSGEFSYNLDFNTQDKIFIEASNSNRLLTIDNRHEFDFYPTDYAMVNNACVTDENIGCRNKRCSDIMLRTSDRTDNDIMQTITYFPDGSKRIYNGETKDRYLGICPNIRLDIDEILEDYIPKEINDLIELNTFPNGMSYYTIKCGSFPQTHVSPSLNAYLDHNYMNPQVTKTGKQYAGRYSTEFGKIIYNDEYYYQGNRYVRVEEPISFGDNTILSDGTVPTATSALWFKVEPIKWIILNWDNVSSKLNPNTHRYKDDNHLELRTEDVIIAGIPFNPNLDNFSYMWQNSLIRAYLNGYDIHKEIKENENGNKAFLNCTNHDYTNKNFLSEAFDLTPIQENSKSAEEIISHSRRKTQSRYGVSIPKSKLTINDQIKYYIDNRRPVMLHGKSGIGKSRRVADIDPDYFLLTLRNGMMPEEILGKECPNPSGAGTKWYAPSWYNELCDKCKNEPNKNHILFIDELTNVNEYEQSLVYHIVLNHSLGVTSGKLPENCVVVAAGNSKDESNSAYNMSEPLFRRFHGHIYLPLDIESLLEWGSESRKENPEQTNLHPLISNYLATYSKSIYTEYDPDKEGKNYAIDPRAWEQVSDIIYDNNGELWEELITNKIGEDNTTQLLAYAEKNFITIDDILTNNYDEEEIPTKLDEQYALALSLRHANEQEIEKVREFISTNLSGETLAKFDFVWVGKNTERAMIIDELQSKQKDLKLEKQPTPAVEIKPAKLHIYKFCGGDYDWKTSNFSKFSMAIKCNTEEQVEYLSHAFNILGHETANGKIYSLDPAYYNNRLPIYFTNYGTHTFSIGANDSYKDKVYNFTDIDFKNVLPNAIVKKIEEMEDETHL